MESAVYSLTGISLSRSFFQNYGENRTTDMPLSQEMSSILMILCYQGLNHTGK